MPLPKYSTLNIFISCLVCVSASNEDLSCVQPIFRTDANPDLHVGFAVNECESSVLRDSVTAVAGWVGERLNFLRVFGELKIGVEIYGGCGLVDMVETVVEAVKIRSQHLGVIFWNEVPRKIRNLGNVLEVPLLEVTKEWKPMVLASVELLSALHWNENLTLITDDLDVLKLFYHESRKAWICVKSVRSFRDSLPINYNDPIIVFGNNELLTHFLKEFNQTTISQLIIVPLDNSQIEELPHGAFIIQPFYADTQLKVSQKPTILPSPILFDIAVPFINMAKNISYTLNTLCNRSVLTEQKSCLSKKLLETSKYENPWIEPQEVLAYLKIEPLRDKFVYNILRVEHFDLIAQRMNKSEEGSDVNVLQSFVKVGTFNSNGFDLEGFVVEGNENQTDNSCYKTHESCIFECFNFQSVELRMFDNESLQYSIVLLKEPWVLAVLSVATLGVIFCVAVLLFIVVRLFKQDIFEGNPIMSVLLLLTLTVMYSSVVPFVLEVPNEVEFRSGLSEQLCLVRTLAVSLTYTAAFSLMLSRCVMLATVAYEAGFMSHITGHVQSFLCLFMVAVQGALSLQSVDSCPNVFADISFMYILAYNILLVILLLCCAPFVYRSQRNYKEGCYFAITIVLVSLIWIAWLSAFLCVAESWKLMVVCIGLLATASAILGTIFIPRTYLMTSAVVRDSLTNALPSLAFANSNSVLDLNYANQHVYDCVNIATINAANRTQAATLTQSNPNFYSDEPCVETIEYRNESPCATPDKVTRF